MSLPAVGDVVTVLFDGDASRTVNGALYGAAGKIVSVDDTGALWTPVNARETNYIARAEFEGVFWMRGAGPEVEAALVASFTLWNSR